MKRSAQSTPDGCHHLQRMCPATTLHMDYASLRLLDLRLNPGLSNKPLPLKLHDFTSRLISGAAAGCWHQVFLLGLYVK